MYTHISKYKNAKIKLKLKKSKLKIRTKIREIFISLGYNSSGQVHLVCAWPWVQSLAPQAKEKVFAVDPWYLRGSGVMVAAAEENSDCTEFSSGCGCLTHFPQTTPSFP
jgi:hypothetical protein